MRAVVQRVSSAAVEVEGETVGRCGQGLLVLLGIRSGDEPATVDRLARKVALLRVFENEEGRFDRSVVDTGGEALVVSQFTLLADSKRQKGSRPDFSKAAPPEVAEPLYERFVDALRAYGVPTQTGVFGARMRIEMVADGPVTIVLDL
jgi:D-tyrosyl-tRNA(Tyr) deacylase